VPYEGLPTFCVVQAATNCHGLRREFGEVQGTSNPFDGMSSSAPFLSDLNADGLLDLILSAKISSDKYILKYYINIGNFTNAAFVEQKGSNNPFNDMHSSSMEKPFLVDLNADGLLDLVAGSELKVLVFFSSTLN